MTETLLLELARTQTERQTKRAIKKLNRYAARIDWRTVLDSAYRIFYPYYLESKRIGITMAIPQGILNNFHFIYISTVEKNKKIEQLVLELAQTFHGAGLNAVFLKGSWAIFTIYRNDPGLRPMSDIDFLVKKEDVPHVEDILKQLGYAEDYALLSEKFKTQLTRDIMQQYAIHYVYFKDGIRTEIHWDVLKKTPTQRLREAFFCSTDQIPVGNTLLTVLKPEGCLFVAISNFIKDFPIMDNSYCMPEEYKKIFFPLLGLFCEMRMIMRAQGCIFAWNDFYAMAKNTRLEYTVYTLLYLSKKLKLIDIQPAILQEISKSKGVGLYMFLCSFVSSRDFIRLLALRNVVRKLSPIQISWKSRNQVIKNLYHAILPYLFVFHTHAYSTARKAARIVKFLHAQKIRIFWA